MSDKSEGLPPLPKAHQKGWIYTAAQMHAYALAAVELATQWRPIETCPRDDTPVDLWADGERLANYRRVEHPVGAYYDPIDSGPAIVRNATHWQPLRKHRNERT